MIIKNLFDEKSGILKNVFWFFLDISLFAFVFYVFWFFLDIALLAFVFYVVAKLSYEVYGWLINW